MANLRRTMPPADGITVRRKSRALFQQHRSIATDVFAADVASIPK